MLLSKAMRALSGRGSKKFELGAKGGQLLPNKLGKFKLRGARGG